MNIVLMLSVSGIEAKYRTAFKAIPRMHYFIRLPATSPLPSKANITLTHISFDTTVGFEQTDSPPEYYAAKDALVYEVRHLEHDSIPLHIFCEWMDNVWSLSLEGAVQAPPSK